MGRDFRGQSMIFTETRLKGAYLIDLEPFRDERGLFARSFCEREFDEHGLKAGFVQCNISYNESAGTLRGLHYQAYPYGEARLVHCLRGAVYDVIVDLRRDSPTRFEWVGVILRGFDPDETNPAGALPRLQPDVPVHHMVYIPEGFAHGFQTLSSNTGILYHMSQFYHPEAARGIRWDDPLLRIRWPYQEVIASEKDRSYVFLEEKDFR